VNGFIYDFPSHDVTRDFFFNVGDSFGITKWGTVALLAGAAAIFLFTIVWKMSIWARGRDYPLPGFRDRRFFSVLKTVFIPKDFLREWYPGLMQLSYVWGFLLLFLCSAAVLVQEYISFLFFGYRFLTGYIYLLWTLASDVSYFLLLAGTALAVFRRKRLRPSRLDTTPQDMAAIVIVALAALSGLLVNALRIAVSDYPGFETWAPVSWLLSLPLALIPFETLMPVHFLAWWGHILSVCVLIAFAGMYKMGRFTAAGINVYCTQPLREDGSDTFAARLSSDSCKGAEFIDDFTWKQLMDLDACITCGRCQDSCPAYLSGLPLSPKTLIGELSRCMDEHNRFANGEPANGEIRDYVSSGELWTCTQCGACVECCPSGVDHVRKVMDMRSSLPARGKAPAELHAAWNNLADKGNRFGVDNSERGKWMSAKSMVPALAENSRAEYLFFAGCASSFDAEAKKSANAFLQLMKNADVSIGVLGMEEGCCGDFALRTGNEGLFRKLAIHNLRNFTRYGVKKIVTACPHGYNILRKEYRALALSLNDPEIRADYEVVHHTQLIASLVAEGKIKPVKSPTPVAMFSDPCFLGRYNKVYDEPRNALRAVPGLMLVDAVHSHEHAVCCGGPLSAYSSGGLKMGEYRAREVHQSGARIAVSACPNCKTMIREGLSEISVENIRTLDIAEFMLESSEG
jgi:Fe-S oxidoreductase